MSGPPAKRTKRVMVQAINMMFDCMKEKETVLIWLYENTAMKIEGTIIGFDEYMNLVLDNAHEVYKTGERTRVGRILLKGDTITLIQKCAAGAQMKE
jgi:small nuclear ribonucleoprotein E